MHIITFVMLIYISADTHVSVRILGISKHGLEYNHILMPSSLYTPILNNIYIHIYLFP